MTTLNPESDVAQLLGTPTKPGTVEWIGLRPERRGPLQSVQEAEAVSGSGLAGDHFHGQGDGKRQVTLIQGEHLDAVGAFMRGPSADPSLARRNIVVRGHQSVQSPGAAFSHRQCDPGTLRPLPPLQPHGGKLWTWRLQRDARSRRHHSQRRGRWDHSCWRCDRETATGRGSGRGRLALHGKRGAKTDCRLSASSAGFW